MNKNLKGLSIALGIGLVLLLGMLFYFSQDTQARDVKLTIHLRGVYQSKISLYPLSGANALKPIAVDAEVRNGGISSFVIPKENLPGEFVVRFDYKENASSNPYPSEKFIIINKQDLELWVHPLYSNNTDSTRFQKNEVENSTYIQFNMENEKQMKMLGLLQNFLLNYDENQSEFYKQGIDEYEKRRSDHNRWIKSEIEKCSDLFAGSLFFFKYLPTISWSGTDKDRKQSLLANYFEGANFNDTLLLNASEFQKWMDAYVNLHMELATTNAQRDSLLTSAGLNSIEAARKGHPRVYGWMVDYFFNGYESFNLQVGINMLAPYLNDPRCLTKKRQAIQKRLQGMQSLQPGTLAPDFSIKDEQGNSTSFHNFVTNAPYKLVLFWSADCEHCGELVKKLYPWHQQFNVKSKMDVFAISLDETETEIPKWEQARKILIGWHHARANGGVNSSEANSYFILSTPVMILVDSKTNKIVALPDTFEKLEVLFK